MRKKSSLTLLSSRKKKTRAAAARAEGDARTAAQVGSGSSSTTSREEGNSTHAAAAAVSDGDAAAAAAACEVVWSPGKTSGSSRQRSEDRLSVAGSAPGQQQRPEQHRQRRQRHQQTGREGEEEEKQGELQTKRKRQRRKQQEEEDDEGGEEEHAAATAAEGTVTGKRSKGSGSNGSAAGRKEKTRLLVRSSPRPTSRWRSRKSVIREDGEEEEDDEDEESQRQRGRSRKRSMTEQKAAGSRGEKDVSLSDSRDADSSDAGGEGGEEAEEEAPGVRRNGSSSRLNGRTKTSYRCRRQANGGGRRKDGSRSEKRSSTRRNAALVEVERRASGAGAASRAVKNQRKVNALGRGAAVASSSGNEEGEDTEDVVEEPPATGRSAATGRGACKVRRRQGRGGAGDAGCLRRRRGGGRRKGGSRRNETARFGRQDERESDPEDVSGGSISGSTCRSGGEAEEKPTDARQGRRGGPGKRKNEKEDSEGEGREDTEQTDCWYDDYFSFNECNVQEELVLDALVATIKKTHTQHYYGNGVMGEQQQEQEQKQKPEEETAAPRSTREERPQREKALSFLASLRKSAGASRKTGAAAASAAAAGGRYRRRDKRHTPTQEEVAAEAAVAAEFEKAAATLRTMTGDALLIKKAWAFVAEDAYETRLAAAAAAASTPPRVGRASVFRGTDAPATASSGSQRGRRQEVATSDMEQQQQGGGGETRGSRTSGGAAAESVTACAAAEPAAAEPAAAAGAAAEAAGSPPATRRSATRGEERAGESASGCAEGGAETRGEKMAEEQDESCGNREEEEERSGREGILSAEMEKRHLLRWNGSSSFEFPLLSASGDLDATLAAAAAAAAEVANEEARGGGEEARETGLRARWQKYVLLRAQRVATELRIQDLIRLQERQGTQRRQSQQSRGEQRRSREDQQQEEAKADEAGSAIPTRSSGYPVGAPASSAEGARTPAGAAVSPVAAAFLAAKGIQKEKEELGKQHMGATAAAEKQGPSATGKNEEEKLVKSENGTENKQRTPSGVAPAAGGFEAAKATAGTSSAAAAHPSSSAVVARAAVTSNIAAAASTVSATAATNAAAVPAGAAASAGAGDVGVGGEASEAVPAKGAVGVCGETAGAEGAKEGGSKAATVVGAGQKETAGSVAVARRADAAVRPSPPAAAAKEETKQGAAEARSTEGERLLKAIGRGDEEDAAPPRVESAKEGGRGEGEGATPSEEKERREDGPYTSSRLGSSRSRSRTPAREESSRSHSLPRGQEEEEEGDEEGAAREKEEEEEEKAEKLLRKLTQADADESLTSSSSSSPSSESNSSDEEDSLYEEEDTALGEPPSSPEEEEEATTRAGGRDAATRQQRAGGNSEMRVEDGKRTAAAAQEEAESTAAGAGGGGKGGATGGRGRGRDTAAATAAPLASEAVAAEDDEEEEEEEEAQEEGTGGMRGKGETGRTTGENTDEEKGKEERKREKRGRTFSVGSASEGGTEAVVAGGSKKKKLSTAAKLRLRWEREKQKKRLKAGETIMEDVFARCSAAPLSIDQATKMKNLSVPATLLLRSQCLYTVEDDWESLHCRKYPNGLLRRGTLATHVFRIEETLEFFLFCRFLNLFASTIDIQWTFDSLVAGFACGSPLPPFPGAATAATRRAGGPAPAGAAKVGSKDGAASPAETQARVAPEATNTPSSLPEEAGSGSSRSSNGNKEKNGEDDNPSSGNRSKSSNSSSSSASESDGSSSNTGTENLCGRRSGCNNYGNFGSTEMFRLLLQKIFSFVGRRFSPGMSLVRMCGRYVEEKRKEGVLPVGMLWPFDYSFKFGVAKRPATRDKDNGSKDSSSQEGSSRSSDRKESSPTTKKESHTSNKKEISSGAETSSTAGGRGGVPAEERTASVPESTCDTEDKTSGSVSSGSSTNKKNVNQFASSSSSMRVAREEDEAEVSSGEKVLMESVYNPFKLCDEWNQLKSIHKLRVVRLLIDQVLSESTQIQKARKKLTDADLEMGYKGTDALGKLYWLVPQCGDETVFKLYREDPSTQRVEILCEDIAGLESVAEALGMDEKTADMKDVLLRCHEDLLIQEKQKSREIRRDKARRRQLEISAWGLPSSARRERKPVDYTYAAYDGTIEGRAPAGAGAGSSAEGQRLDRGERLRARQAKKEERMTAEAIEVAESSGETAPTEGNGAAGAGRQAAASTKDLADTKKPTRKRQPKGAAVVLRSQADVLRQHQAYLMQHRHHSHFALQQSQALLLSQQLQRMQEEKEAAARQGAAGRVYQPQQQQPLQGAVGNNVGVTCSAPAAVAQLPQAAVAMLQQRLQQVHHHLLQQEGLTAQQRQAALQHACARLQAELLARYGAVSAERTATPQQQQQQLIQQHLLRQQQQQQLQARHQLQQQHMMQQHLQHLQEQAQRQQFMHPSQHQQQQVQRQVPHHNVQDCDLIERRAALLQQSYQAQQLNIARGGGGTLPQQRVQPPNYLMATAFNAAVRAANGAPPVSAAAVAANAISCEAAYAGFLRQPVGGAESNACRTVPVDTVPHAALVYDRADLRMSCSGGGGKEDAMHRKTGAAYIPERRVAPMDASSCSIPPPGTGFSQSGGSANVTIGGGATASSGAPVSAGNIPYAVWASAGGRNSAAVPANVVLSHSTGDPPSHAAAPGRPVGATPASSPYPGLSLSSNAPRHAAAPSLVPLPHAKTSTSHPAALPSSSVGSGGIRSSSSQTRGAPQLPCPIPAHLDTLRSSSHALPSRALPCSTDGERYSVHSLRESAEPASATVEEGYGTSVNFNGAGDTTDQVKGGGGFKPFADEQQRHHVHGCKSYEGRG